MHIRFMFKNVAGRRHVAKHMQDALGSDVSEECRWLSLNQWHRASGDEAKSVVDAFKSNHDGVVWVDDKQGHRPTEKSMEQRQTAQSLSKLAIDERRDGLDELAAFVKAIKKRSAAKEKAAKVAADHGRKPAEKPASQKSESRPTHASLEEFASGLERDRRGRYGDGKPTGEPRRDGTGLYEASMRSRAPLTEGAGFELVYSTGGGGGPYPSEDKAKEAAAKLLKGNKNERWIAIIPAKDAHNLTKAKALWVLKQSGDWVKGPQPLPNINPLKHLQAQAESSTDRQNDMALAHEDRASELSRRIAEAIQLKLRGMGKQPHAKVGAIRTWGGVKRIKKAEPNVWVKYGSGDDTSADKNATLGTEVEHQKSEAYKTKKNRDYYPKKPPAGMKLPKLPAEFEDAVKSMPDADLSQSKSHNHPAVKALAKKLIADVRSGKMSFEELQAQSERVRKARDAFSDAQMLAKTDAESDPPRFAARKMTQVHRAYNDALYATMPSPTKASA